MPSLVSVRLGLLPETTEIIAEDQMEPDMSCFGVLSHAPGNANLICSGVFVSIYYYNNLQMRSRAVAIFQLHWSGFVGTDVGSPNFWEYVRL